MYDQRIKDQTNEQWLTDHSGVNDMGLTVKNDGGNFTPAPAGNHVAICYGVLDLGTQHNDAFTYEGKTVPASDRPQILVMWEFPHEKVEIEGEQKPATISHFYNASFNEKATLRLHLEAWRGRQFSEEELCGFDISALLGKSCMVNVVHKENGKAKVAGVAAMVKGMDVPDVTNTLVSFDMDNYDQAVFDSISEGIQNIIKRSPEWQALNQPTSGFRQAETSPQDQQGGWEDDKDIPF